MRKTLLLVVLLVLSASYPLAGSEFTRMERWQHDELIPGLLYDAVVDKDGVLIAGFQKTLVKVATAKKIGDLGPYGQGPDDLDAWFAIMLYKGDLAVEGMAGKLKVFHKKDGKYTWKQTVWKKFHQWSHFMVSDGLFTHGKWFFSGVEAIPIGGIGSKNFEIYFIRVYEENGKYIKSLVKKNYKKSQAFPIQLLDYYLETYGDNLFFIAEDEPKVTVISPQTLEIKRTAALKMPPFYKPMPQDNYRYKKDSMTLSDIERSKVFASWKTNYSRICRIAVDKNRLILQVRTCTKDLKRYALLFYNADTFQLDRVVLTDDLLLAVRDGKYYLFENGDPGYDEEAGDFVINIHQFKDNKSHEKK